MTDLAIWLNLPARTPSPGRIRKLLVRRQAKENVVNSHETPQLYRYHSRHRCSKTLRLWSALKPTLTRKVEQAYSDRNTEAGRSGSAFASSGGLAQSVSGQNQSCCRKLACQTYMWGAACKGGFALPRSAVRENSRENQALISKVGFFEKMEFKRLTSTGDPIDFLSHKRHELVSQARPTTASVR